MNKLVLMIAIFSLAACSTNPIEIKYTKKSPRGISVLNVTKEMQSKAYQAAEIHCARYSKVPRVLKTIKQILANDMQAPMNAMVFECIRPSN